MAARRGYGTIRKLPSGRWQARRWDYGVQMSAPNTFATKADASTWLAAVETDVARGQFVDPSKGTVTFGKYAREWMEHKANLQPRTRETYESQLWAILEKFERVPLGRLEPPAIRKWHAELLRSGRHANTVAKIYRLFRSILVTAVEDGLIRANPCHIKRASNEVISERPALTPEDVHKLANAIEPRFFALVWTAAPTGPRVGELTGLVSARRRHGEPRIHRLRTLVLRARREDPDRS